MSQELVIQRMLRSCIMMALDALKRADDGADVALLRNHNADYVSRQLTIAVEKTRWALRLNEDIRQAQIEGETPDVFPEASE